MTASLGFEFFFKALYFEHWFIRYPKDDFLYKSLKVGSVIPVEIL